jgi:rare lipoprotein A (peptidoglycan hydrolase)
MKTQAIAGIITVLMVAGLVSVEAQWPPRFFAESKEPRGHPIVVCATWYRVPADSIARRRAGVNELTAAHNRLPLGTLVRVTNVSNGKSVLVRITDRGIPAGQCAIDICQEAAKQLGILSEGIARVRLDVFPKSMTVLNPDGNHPAAP